MLRWILAISAALPALPAAAGPWARQDDSFYSRIAITRGSVESLDSYRIDAYSEYGLTDDWTATLKYERVQFDQFSQFNADGWRATVRRGVRLPYNLAAAVEAGALQGAAIGGAAGCEALGFEGRAGIGQSLTFGKKKPRPAYWFLEGAVRAHEDGCVRQRIEAGYGQRVSASLWAVSQVWYEEGNVNSSSMKYQVEYVLRTDPADFSIGLVSEMGGQFEETGVFFAVARTF